MESKISEFYAYLTLGPHQMWEHFNLKCSQSQIFLLTAFDKTTPQYSRVSSSASCFHRMFDSKGREVRRSEFPAGGSYSSPIREGSFDLRGDRVTRLGANMYVSTVCSFTTCNSLYGCTRITTWRRCVFHEFKGLLWTMQRRHTHPRLPLPR